MINTVQVCYCLNSLHNHTRNSRFDLPSGRLYVERTFAIFQSKKCFTVAPAQLCVPMSDDALKDCIR